MDHSEDNDSGGGNGFSDIRPGNVANFSAENDGLPEMSGSGAADVPGKEGFPAGSAEEQHDSQNGTVGLDVSVKQEKKPSPRMEKLRAYYAQLGQAREMMEKELEAALSGSTVEGEVEAKLYEFSHSWRSIADEISKYDDLNGAAQKSVGRGISCRSEYGRDGFFRAEFGARRFFRSEFARCQF